MSVSQRMGLEQINWRISFRRSANFLHGAACAQTQLQRCNVSLGVSDAALSNSCRIGCLSYGPG